MIVRHVSLLYGIYFVLGSITTFVKNGIIESPLKAAMQVEKNVYRATAHHLLHVSNATPNSKFLELGPHDKNLESSCIIIITNITLEIIVHIASKPDRRRLSSKRNSQNEHITSYT
jgi:hypothetical protein